MKFIQEIPDDAGYGEDNGLPGRGCLAVTGAVIAFWVILLVIIL